MALQFIITDAGRAALAQVGGAIGPVTLTKIAIGSGGYAPAASQTALQSEIKQINPSGSSVPIPGTLSITGQDNSDDSYSVKEIGLMTNNGVLFAICSQTSVIMTKGSGAVALFAMDIVLTNVPTESITVGNVGFTYSLATENSVGVLGIATTAEAQAGTIDTKIITPLKMAQVTATESRRGVIALATTAEAQALAPDATKALTVARLVDRTATTSRSGVVELADNTETKTGTDTSRAVTPAGLASAASLFVPPGAVMPFASATTPSGWLAANGDVVTDGMGTVQGTTANFKPLFDVLGSTFGAVGKLPDLRGYFIRGSGRNIDATQAGTFGRKQPDSFGSHGHSASSDIQGSHAHSYTDNFNRGGFNQTSSSGSAQYAQTETRDTTAAGSHNHTITVNAAGGDETRPKNIALLYCVKI